jgi:hypothetical protein
MTVAPPPKPTTFEPIVQANGRSLFHLAMEAQEIDGELAIAVAQLSSEDPEEASTAEELVSSILQRANTSQQSLLDKVNQMAFVVKSLSNRAAYFKQQVETYEDKSKRDQSDADRLLRYMGRTLEALHPGQSKFHLSDYDLATKLSPGETEILDNQQVPPDLCRHEIIIKVPAGLDDMGLKLHQAISDFIAEMFADVSFGSLTSDLLPTLKPIPIKNLVKERIKQDPAPEETRPLPVACSPATHEVVLRSDAVPGAAVIRKKTWSIK